MLNWSSKHIALIAVFFFTAFVGVFTTNALCDLEIIEYAPNLAHSHNAESEDSHHKDDHHHSQSSDDSSHSSDPCCEDVTSQLESSLFNKIVKNQTLEAKYFLFGEVTFSNRIVSLYQPIRILYHEFDDPPPLAGFAIRVLIQSFLN